MLRSSQYVLGPPAHLLTDSYRACSEEKTMKNTEPNHHKRKLSLLLTFAAMVLLLPAISVRAQIQQIPPDGGGGAGGPAPTAVCGRTIKADVVALDQVIMYNRLGTI